MALDGDNRVFDIWTLQICYRTIDSWFQIVHTLRLEGVGCAPVWLIVFFNEALLIGILHMS